MTEMRELTFDEINEVSGGNAWGLAAGAAAWVASNVAWDVLSDIVGYAAGGGRMPELPHFQQH